MSITADVGFAKKLEELRACDRRGRSPAFERKMKIPMWILHNVLVFLGFNGLKKFRDDINVDQLLRCLSPLFWEEESDVMTESSEAAELAAEVATEVVEFLYDSLFLDKSISCNARVRAAKQVRPIIQRLIDCRGPKMKAFHFRNHRHYGKQPESLPGQKSLLPEDDGRLI